MNIHIKEFALQDQPKVKDFILRMWKEFGFYYMAEFDADLDDPYTHYVVPGGAFYLMKDDDKIIGTIGVINKKDNVAELKRFYIDPNYRRKGYGTQLFNKALEFCKSYGFTKVEFETGKAFTQGHAFYKKLGFVTVKEDEESYFMEKNL